MKVLRCSQMSSYEIKRQKKAKREEIGIDLLQNTVNPWRILCQRELTQHLIVTMRYYTNNGFL